MKRLNAHLLVVCIVRGDIMPSFLRCLLFEMHVTNMLMDIGKKKVSALAHDGSRYWFFLKDK